MQCACVTLPEKLRGRLNLLYTFPGGHWIRVNIHPAHRKVVCLLNKIPQRGLDSYVETRSEPYDETYKYSQPDSYIYSQPATIALLWSEGLLGKAANERRLNSAIQTKIVCKC